MRAQPLSDWTVVHPPAAERAWQVGGSLTVSTGAALWILDSQGHARIWPIAGVRELSVEGERWLLDTSLGRQLLGQPPDPPLRRTGLHAVAHWEDGWQIDGLHLPRGARRAADLAPLAHGIGACWTDLGQPFLLDAVGVRATRQLQPGWDAPLHRTDLVPVGVARSGHRLWGPGRCLWDLRDGSARPLPDWRVGPAVAHGTRVAVVDAESGSGLHLEEDVVIGEFTVPLRRDAVAELSHGDGLIATTELGRRFRIEGDSVRRVSGRMLPETPDPLDVGVPVDGVAELPEAVWAWRSDGLLLRRRRGVGV